MLTSLPEKNGQVAICVTQPIHVTFSSYCCLIYGSFALNWGLQLPRSSPLIGPICAIWWCVMARTSNRVPENLGLPPGNEMHFSTVAPTSVSCSEVYCCRCVKKLETEYRFNLLTVVYSGVYMEKKTHHNNIWFFSLVVAVVHRSTLMNSNTFGMQITTFF